MLRLLLLMTTTLLLAGCSYFHAYRPNIQQGTIINNNNVNQLRVGMTESQVIKLMGYPILENTFADNRVTYVYQFYPNHGKSVKKIVTLTFRNGRVSQIQKRLDAPHRSH